MPPATRATDSHGAAASSNATSLGPSYRLAYRGGRWILVKKQLVALDRNVLRPQSRQYVGTETILHYLQTAEPHLKQRAATLMQTRPEYPDQSFDPRQGEWIESNDDDSGTHAVADSLRDEELTLLRELRAEMLLLRGSHQRLRARVAELERRTHLASFEAPPPPRIERPRVRHVEFARALPNTELEAPCEPNPAAKLRLESAAAVPAQRVDEPQPPPAPLASVSLPKVEELFQCISDLVGEEVTPTASKDKLQTLEAAAGILYVAALLDDENRQVGAFVLEASSVAGLGGALLGIPARAVQEHVAQGEPSGDMIEAASEVCNNLSGVLNRLWPNCHVRTTPLGRYTPSEVEWLGPNPPHCVCFAIESGGRTWLVLR